MTQSFISNNNEKVFYLDSQSIIELHEVLSNNIHLLEEMDPVEPRGVKNFGMLESAVSRQTTGSGSYYKYPNACSNAATLVYGIIKNHAFHNGNKRAGLLALIKHLYINGYVLSPSLDSEELYEILVAIADSKIPEFYAKYIKKYGFIRTKEEKKTNEWDLETQLRFLAFWIKRNSKPKELTNKGEIKISTLKKVLDNKNIEMNQNGSNLEVYINEDNKFLGFIKIGTKTIMKKNYSLGNSRTTIGKTTLNVLRNDFKLNKINGIDDTFFYDEEAFLDSEIKTYKKIIYQLSKT